MSKMYEKSGVNLFEAQKLNESLSKKLHLNAFAGVAQGGLLEGFNLVTCCDGIGSKIIPLYKKGHFQTIAKDVVAANLNDLICSGATAVGFVDYIAVHKLENEKVSKIVESINTELKMCNCKLLGGETSEISELITKDNIDISGFAVGVVKNGEELNKENVQAEDVVIGLSSSGIHANGFSLIRKLHKDGKLTDKEFETCLKPTHIYYNSVKKLVEKKLVSACANITGGGIVSNLVRSIPENLDLELDFEKIPKTKDFEGLFEKLKTICGDEFYDVFNAGVGFCIIAKEENADLILKATKEFSPFVFGKIKEKQ